jgi:RsiW-degrading membrane proteinase PrsW (M82 family)
LFFTAFAVAGLVEECVKAFFLQHCVKLYLPYRDYLNRSNASTIIWLGVAVGLGFGTTEGVLYTCVYGIAGSFLVQFVLWLIRVLVAIPFHTTTGFMWGIELAKRDCDGQDRNWIQMGWEQVVWHGFYDFVAMEYYVWESSTSLGWIILGCVIAVAICVCAAIRAYLKYKTFMVVQQHQQLLDEEDPEPQEAAYEGDEMQVHHDAADDTEPR